MSSLTAAPPPPPHISISHPAEDRAPLAPPPPAYTTSSTLTRSRSQSTLSSQTSSLPPGYDETTATASPALTPEDVSFYPTAAFQIQTPGKGWVSCPGPTRPDPIPIYAVDPAAATADACPIDITPRYVSLRAARRSGNCVLIHGQDFPDVYAPGPSARKNPNITPSPTTHVLASTLYRFGCGRAPQVRVYPAATGPDPATAFGNMKAAKRAKVSSETEAWALDSAGAGDVPGYTLEEEEKDAEKKNCTVSSPGTAAEGKAFTAPLNPVSPVSRAIRFATPQGTFQWRYAARAERKGLGANSLLVLENLIPLPGATDVFEDDGDDAQKKNKNKEAGHVRVPVGYFVRSEATRSPGSGRSTAGNGGRLLLDLRAWSAADGKQQHGGDLLQGGIVDEKRRLVAAGEASCANVEAVERVAIATCLAMLKKEVDRRRLHQSLIFAAAVGGGGGP